MSVEELASSWRAIAEVEKAESDVARAREVDRFEKLKFWVPIIASLISTMALVATVIFQVYQFRENTRLSKEAEEDTQWRETLNRVKVTQGPEGAFGIMMLKTFFDSSRYGRQSREVGTRVLGHMGDEDTFDLLFEAIMDHTDWSNSKDVAVVSKLLVDGYSAIGEDIDRAQKEREELEKQSSTSPAASHGLENIDREIQRLTGIRDIAVNEIKKVSEAFVKLLKDPEQRSHAKGHVIDLTGLQFYDANLSRIDFRNVNLVGVTFNNCDVTDADFDGLNEGRFTNSSWNSTAWWRIKRVSPDLLDYLQTNWAFNGKGDDYQGAAATAAEYAAALTRLKGDLSPTRGH